MDLHRSPVAIGFYWSTAAAVSLIALTYRVPGPPPTRAYAADGATALVVLADRPRRLGRRQDG